MATRWVKSLQCKSRVTNDVVDHHHKTPKHRRLPASSSCRKNGESLKDVIEPTKKNKPTQPSLVKLEPGSNRKTLVRTISLGPLFSTLTELPVGHPSRNVVELIFRSSWSPKPFSIRVKMVFKIRSSSRTMTRFEEYRERLKSRVTPGSGEDHARCAVDGNEVMGFHCLGPIDKGLGYDGAWAIHGVKGAICTFSGGGGAHESAGGGMGRRAMLVCRVIAGRVCKEIGLKSLLEGRDGFDSVSGDMGELLVFDSRAVLPCFLIIYKL